MRELVNVIFYALRSGCPWRLLPDSFPPPTTVYRWFSFLCDRGIWQVINHRLVMLDRERTGRSASPIAAVLDSQSIRTAEAGGPRGYDAGKKIMGRKRQVLVDTDGRGLTIPVQAACIQDRDGAAAVLVGSRSRSPFIERAFADAGYAGERVNKASRIDVEIIRKALGQIGLAVQPRRWVVERFFGWITRNRRLYRDVEARVASAEAFLYAAASMILIRRLGRC
jgi:putative transposase